MHHHYDDIRDLIRTHTGLEPTWFDEYAVPRYCAFHPKHLADIYANEAVLAEIECQNCRRRLKVAFSRSTMDDVQALMAKLPKVPLAMHVTDQTLNFGDPPNIRCCASGPTMSSDMRRVLEFWTRRNLEWERDPALEIMFD